MPNDKDQDKKRVVSSKKSSLDLFDTNVEKAKKDISKVFDHARKESQIYTDNTRRSIDTTIGYFDKSINSLVSKINGQINSAFTINKDALEGFKSIDSNLSMIESKANTINNNINSVMSGISQAISSQISGISDNLGVLDAKLSLFDKNTSGFIKSINGSLKSFGDSTSIISDSIQSSVDKSHSSMDSMLDRISSKASSIYTTMSNEYERYKDSVVSGNLEIEDARARIQSSFDNFDLSSTESKFDSLADKVDKVLLKISNSFHSGASNIISKINGLGNSETSNNIPGNSVIDTNIVGINSSVLKNINVETEKEDSEKSSVKSQNKKDKSQSLSKLVSSKIDSVLYNSTFGKTSPSIPVKSEDSSKESIIKASSNNEVSNPIENKIEDNNSKHTKSVTSEMKIIGSAIVGAITFLGSFWLKHWRSGIDKYSNAYESSFTNLASRMDTGYNGTRDILGKVNKEVKSSGQKSVVSIAQDVIPALENVAKSGFSGDVAVQKALSDSVDSKIMPWMDTQSDAFNNMYANMSKEDIKAFKSQQLALQQTQEGNRLLQSGVINSLTSDIEPLMRDMEFGINGKESLSADAQALMEQYMSNGMTDKEAYAAVTDVISTMKNPFEAITSGNASKILQAQSMANGGSLIDMAASNNRLYEMAASSNSVFGAGAVAAGTGVKFHNGVASKESASSHAIDSDKANKRSADIQAAAKNGEYDKRVKNSEEYITATKKFDTARENETASVALLANAIPHGTDILEGILGFVSKIANGLAGGNFLNAVKDKLLDKAMNKMFNKPATAGSGLSKKSITDRAKNLFNKSKDKLGDIKTKLGDSKIGNNVKDMFQKFKNKFLGEGSKLSDAFSKVKGKLTSEGSKFGDVFNKLKSKFNSSGFKDITSNFKNLTNGLGNKIKNVFSKFKGSGSSSGVKNAISKLGSNLKGLTKNFSGTAKNLLSKAGGKLGSVASKAGSGLTKVGSKALGKLGSLGGGAAAGIAGGILGAVMAAKDAIGGVKKSKEWLGSDSTGDKVAAGIGGALGGTGPGLFDKGSAKDKAKNIGGNALKGAGIGAAIGSIIPGVGTAIGAAIGGGIGTITGAIGGKGIAKGARAIGKVATAPFKLAKKAVKGVGGLLGFGKDKKDKDSLSNISEWVTKIGKFLVGDTGNSKDSDKLGAKSNKESKFGGILKNTAKIGLGFAAGGLVGGAIGKLLGKKNDNKDSSIFGRSLLGSENKENTIFGASAADQMPDNKGSFLKTAGKAGLGLAVGGPVGGALGLLLSKKGKSQVAESSDTDNAVKPAKVFSSIGDTNKTAGKMLFGIGRDKAISDSDTVKDSGSNDIVIAINAGVKEIIAAIKDNKSGSFNGRGNNVSIINNIKESFKEMKEFNMNSTLSVTR